MAKSSAPSDPAALLAEADDRLAHGMPSPKCELDHRNPWELLVATILSAQAKDSVINEITPELFRRWPGPAELAQAPIDELEQVVKRSGYFRNKAKAIRECAQALVERHGGEVPRDHEALISLPGASHKTANLVLGIAFGIASGIVVDTHVARVGERLGVVGESRPEAIEAALCKLVARERWIDFSHRFILHGRHLCTAAQPACQDCPIAELCPSCEHEPIGDWRDRSEREGRLAAARGDHGAAGLEPPRPASARPPAPASARAPEPATEPATKPAAKRTPPPEQDDF
ncbi:endonuclease III [Nannocystaceae bacterium ST9]